MIMIKKIITISFTVFISIFMFSNIALANNNVDSCADYYKHNEDSAKFCQELIEGIPKTFIIGEELECLKEDDNMCMILAIPSGMEGLIVFLRYLIMVVGVFVTLAAIFMIMWGGIQIIFSGANPESKTAGIKKIKQAIAGVAILFLIALILNILNQTFYTFGSVDPVLENRAIVINDTLFPKAYASNTLEQISDQLPMKGQSNFGDWFKSLSGNIIQTLVSYLGVFAVLFFMFGALHIVFSLGQDEKVKKGQEIIINALLGAVVGMLVYVIIRIIITNLL